MKYLNNQATEVFNKLIALAKDNEGHVKIKNNDVFKPVSVEHLYTHDFGAFKAESYSIAHYDIQNGDLMADPEITFIFIPDLNRVYPSSFTNHYVGIYKESLFEENGKWKIWEKEQTDEAIFCNTWMMNIKQQQQI
jgi:hypothetical protein